MNKNSFPNFRSVPKTGVIYAMQEARIKGFSYGNPDWCNLGQGAPETGPLPGGAERLDSIPLSASICEYGPVPGIMELRSAVAELYNYRYRKGKKTQYSAENVAISAGGRVGLARIAASLGSVNLGHFLPDYTAYEELLDLFRYFVPIPIVLRESDDFMPSPEQLEDEIVGKGLGAVLISNPCNPTGQVIYGHVLEQWIQTALKLQCAMIFDEFYSHYLYEEAVGTGSSSSAAAYIEEVDQDPVIIVDGFTKNWRYPGLRLSWTVAPKSIITRIASAGSFLDGGAPHAIQKAAIPLLHHEIADQEARAIQNHFSKKRTQMYSRLTQLGFKVPSKPPKGSFYIFVSLEDLPHSLVNGMDFFMSALNHKVICIPGVFFDVNPGKRRSHIPSRLRPYVRFSYGPSATVIRKGLNRIEAMILEHQI